MTDLVPRPTSGVFDVFLRVKERARLDQYGFPTVIYDHAHIPPDLFEREPATQEAILRAAGLRVSLMEGYPAVQGSVDPIWSCLPHEPDHFFRAFRVFVTSAERRLGEICETFPDIPPGTVQELYEFYYWPERARAYDILRPAVAARLRDQRVINMEDDHFSAAQGVLKMALQELQKRTETEGWAFAGTKTKDLVEIITKVSEMQRVALRLPAKGPLPAKEDEGSGAGPQKQLEAAVQDYEGVTGDDRNTEAETLRQRLRDHMAESPDHAKELQDVAMKLLSGGTSDKQE